MRFIATALALSTPLTIAVVPSMAAQTQSMAVDATKWVGMKVLDPQGGDVGSVQAVRGAIVIVKTNRLDASLPATSFTFQNGKLYFGMTQAQLNAEIEKTVAAEKAALESAMDVGSTVKGSAGNPVGTIAAVDDQFVTIKLLGGKDVRIPKAGIAATAQGAVIGMTAAALEAQVAGGTSE